MRDLKNSSLMILSVIAMILLIVGGLTSFALADQWYEDRDEATWGWPQPTATAGAIARGYGPTPHGSYSIAYHYGYRSCGGQVITYRMDVTMYHGGYHYTQRFYDGTTWGYGETHYGTFLEIETETTAYFRASGIFDFTLTAHAELP